MKNIAIIGAGFAGLVIANKLKANHNVTVFEKSRGVGGRMATRYADNYQFDHGAQYFKAKSQEFKEFIAELRHKELIEEWNARFVEMDGQNVIKENIWDENTPHMVATPKMNQIGKFLAKNINVKTNCHIDNLIKYDKTWKIFDKEGVCVGSYEYIVLAIPPKQIESIILDSIKFKGELSKYKMSGCFSLMLGYKKPKDLPFEAALVINQDISWISVNSSKPARPEGYSILVHSANEWADKNMEADIQWVRSHLINELEKVTNLTMTDHDYINIHRWRYANIEKQTGPAFLEDSENNIAAIGDWLIQGRVESAFTSALSLYNNTFKDIK